MKKNVGKMDKLLRLLITMVLIVIAYTTKMWWLYLVSIIPLSTAVLGYCPLYSVLKCNTCKIDSEEDKK